MPSEENLKRARELADEYLVDSGKPVRVRVPLVKLAQALDDAERRGEARATTLPAPGIRRE